MKFDILTIFPEIFPTYLATSILGRAQKNKLISVNVHNIRVHATNKYQTVDDTPYGGGAGMIMKIEPIDKALTKIRQQKPANPKPTQNTKTIALSARGKQFTQSKAKEYAKLDQLVLICGRYEGIDQRVIDYLANEEISIGPYILNGGEVAAMAIIEAVSRLVPKVLGNPQSLAEESFTAHSTEYPQYTKPAQYKGWVVPKILLSGNHLAIAKWRASKSRQK